MKEQIEELIDKFDFAKAHKLFYEMGWTYWDQEGTPSIARLKETAKSLLENAVKQEGLGLCSSGHFQALKFEDELNLQLVFHDDSVYL